MSKINTITVGGKKYVLDMEELQAFFDACQEELNLFDISSVEKKIIQAQDLMITNSQKDSLFGEVKECFILLRELKLLFAFGFIQTK